MIKNYLRNKDFIRTLAFAIVGILIVLIADDYFLYVGTSWLIFGILGLSLDILWGKGGILSLGQTIFYGLGGYGGAVVAINFFPIFGNTFLLVIPVGIIIGTLVAGSVGSLMFYGRMGKLQITILTYALTLIVWTFSLSFSIEIGEAIIGGDNGMSNIPEMILAFGKETEGINESTMFFCVLIISLICLIFAQLFIKTPSGKVIECIRLDIQKTELLGYDVRKYQTILFMISGALAGLGGALFALWANYLNPSIFSVNESLLVPIYVLVGGLGTLLGAFLGAFGVGSLSFYLGGFARGQATLVIGLILILMVLFFDKGLLGAIEYFFNKLFSGTSSKKEPLHMHIDTSNYKIHKNDEVTLFSTTNIYKSFGGVVPVNKITSEFTNGKVSCIIGPNGAGKSSYLRVCMGIYPIEYGEVYLGNKNITKWQLAQRVQNGLGIKMQKPQVFKTFSVRENIWIASYSRWKNKGKADEVTNNTLNLLGGLSQGEKRADTLSHGEQQWLDIAMVLSLSPSIILFDEPAAGMTANERKELSKLMIQLSKDNVVIIVEHDMDFIRNLDSDVMVLHQGEVFANGSIEELHKDDRILDIYLGRK